MVTLEEFTSGESLCEGTYIDVFGNVQGGCHPENNIDPTFGQVLSLVGPILLSCLLVGIGIKLAAGAVLIKFGQVVSWRTLRWLPLVSLVSIPFFVLVAVILDDVDFSDELLIASSLFLMAVASLLEAVIYYFINKKKTSFKQVLWFTAVPNMILLGVMFSL